jgi:hypothetical protein
MAAHSSARYTACARSPHASTWLAARHGSTHAACWSAVVAGQRVRDWVVVRRAAATIALATTAEWRRS